MAQGDAPTEGTVCGELTGLQAGGQVELGAGAAALQAASAQRQAMRRKLNANGKRGPMNFLLGSARGRRQSEVEVISDQVSR